ncbi:VOC family protein [Sorangium sp. So ce131]|uniref:VOC family protein n=1 Tax=Sorangium sp. So ce131 TaxID=3133282 RepID=UPI003F5EFEEE
MAVKPVPEERPALSPYLVVRGAARAIAFYVEAFGAKELYRLSEPSGKVGHAELEIGGARFMLADEYPDFGAVGPLTIGGSPVSLHLYVEDVDRTVERATKAGATLLRPVKDEFFGDRTGMVADPFGHKWHLATHKEDVSPEEMQKRMNAAFA